MNCALLSEFLLCLDKKMVTKNRKIHFFHWCIVQPEGMLHLTNVSLLQHSCKPVHEVMNKSSETEMLEAPGLQVVTAKKTPKWMYIVSLCDVLFTL
jgi:hypothetical protein